MIFRRESERTCSLSAETVSLAIRSLVVSRMAEASTSCSAWDMRSAAKKAGLAVSSATMRISLGPATISISTVP